MIRRKRFTIGIDPGAHTGFAVYDREADRIVRAVTLDFGRTLALLEAEYPPEVCDLVVEDASLNKPTFRRDDDLRKQDRMSRNVGSVQAESKLMISELRRHGYNVRPVRPTKVKGEPRGKWSQRAIAAMTGYTGSTSQHARDAIVLCWNVRVVRPELNASIPGKIARRVSP